MKLPCLSALLLLSSFGQDTAMPQGSRGGNDIDPHLAHTQREALIKADHKKNVEDAEALFKLAEELKADLEKDDAHIVSIKSMKKAEEIERLAKSIHGRLKRY